MVAGEINQKEFMDIALEAAANIKFAKNFLKKVIMIVILNSLFAPEAINMYYMSVIINSL